MSVLLVLVAHNGKTLQLDVQPNTRVDAVQQALVSFTGIPMSDQIVMCQGARLDATKTLAAYKLPVDDPSAVEDNPVYLYSKAYLRPSAAIPAEPPLPSIDLHVPALQSVLLHHPLHSALSPVVRALPDYERHFQHHLMAGKAFWDASQQRMKLCRQLLSQQEVQARAADAARANVEAHFTYICNVYQSFMERYMWQYQLHGKMLAHFPELMLQLSSTALQPQIQTDQWQRLSDLRPQQKLKDYVIHCRRSHEHFASKVHELEALFERLHKDVESLFLQAPSIDLDLLGEQLIVEERRIDEQSSIVQVLSKDLRTVRQLVEDTVRDLGGGVPYGGSTSAATSSSVLDMCRAIEDINNSHMQQLLPQVRQADQFVDALKQRCFDAKQQMTREVMETAAKGAFYISAQQSKIRDMKNQLAAFNEVLTRQDDAFHELKHLQRLPSAYRLCLSECFRRKAWLDMYGVQATKLAEHMAHIREKEVQKREAFQRRVESYIPGELLNGMGLIWEPPHCQISVPTSDAHLLPVTFTDLQRLPMDNNPVMNVLQEDKREMYHGGLTGESSAEVGQGGSRIIMELENARLRSELACQVAAACIKNLPEEDVAETTANVPTAQFSAPPALTINPWSQTLRKVTGTASSASNLTLTQSAQQHMERSSKARSQAMTTRADPRDESVTPGGAGGNKQQDALRSLQQALQSKDEYVALLQRELSNMHSQMLHYERRIPELERLGQQNFKDGNLSQIRREPKNTSPMPKTITSGESKGLGASPSDPHHAFADKSAPNTSKESLSVQKLPDVAIASEDSGAVSEAKLPTFQSKSVSACLTDSTVLKTQALSQSMEGKTSSRAATLSVTEGREVEDLTRDGAKTGSPSALLSPDDFQFPAKVGVHCKDSMAEERQLNIERPSRESWLAGEEGETRMGLKDSAPSDSNVLRADTMKVSKGSSGKDVSDESPQHQADDLPIACKVRKEGDERRIELLLSQTSQSIQCTLVPGSGEAQLEKALLSTTLDQQHSPEEAIPHHAASTLHTNICKADPSSISNTSLVLGKQDLSVHGTESVSANQECQEGITSILSGQRADETTVEMGSEGAVNNMEVKSTKTCLMAGEEPSVGCSTPVPKQNQSTALDKVSVKMMLRAGDSDRLVDMHMAVGSQQARIAADLNTNESCMTGNVQRMRLPTTTVERRQDASLAGSEQGSPGLQALAADSHDVYCPRVHSAMDDDISTTMPISNDSFTQVDAAEIPHKEESPQHTALNLLSSSLHFFFGSHSGGSSGRTVSPVHNVEERSESANMTIEEGDQDAVEIARLTPE